MTGRRGAKPGNKNALKHGFYTQWYSDAEDLDLSAYMAQGTEQEIHMLRVFIRRILMETKRETDPKELIFYLAGVGLAAERLAALLRTQFLIGGGKDNETAETIKNAIMEINKDFNLKV